MGEVSGVSEAGMCRGDGLVVNAVEVGCVVQGSRVEGFGFRVSGFGSRV